ncbi:protein phosphatase 2C domain-containing protein [Leifsonia sp. H3M29-4]|uniref:PP2C family protein-serine/threonine phosphatase n=1 Tax=Salinibacterium metalliresistens TaxID=3031321 RepID=UPI0023DAE8C8|nr:protein phosphatase 2C domain-containing protein [Salinibacterium metalliresistens]MDF1477784.1 protein phosphatase 2C domain-containing protein [Salinibacterium metalliresistens]
MAPSDKSAAVSHVGKIRANNQDSGYAGRHLFVVADGMGGHAGGDVASAIAVKRIAETDQSYPSAADAEFALRKALLAANTLLAETVFEHGELTGMGTTVSGILRVGDKVALAHIGDSRVYLFRDGELRQITNDHTFVQRLVDSGRITPEEAAVHPRRSVLMRVLGDVDAAPEVDTAIFDTQPGDRWLLCSDGLSSYVSDDKMSAILSTVPFAHTAAERLVKESLDAGAPDNVTVVLVDVDDTDDSSSNPPVTVGSAAAPLSFEPESQRRPLRLPSLLLHPLKATQTDDSHFEPESDEYLDALIAEDRRRARRRRITWLAFLLIVVAAIITGLVLGYQYTQRQYFVGASGDRVAIFQGVQQDIGPIELSHVVETTTIRLDELPMWRRESVEATINADDLSDARRIVELLSDARVP